MVNNTTTITYGIKVVELVPATKLSITSFITVHIDNCTIRITNQPDLSLFESLYQDSHLVRVITMHTCLSE